MRALRSGAVIAFATLGAAALGAVTFGTAALAQTPQPPQRHNVVLFVADGLRFRMVDDTTAPAMAALAREGVSLRNSHALFPTLTTANASAMATGHMLGGTGDYANTLYTGFEVDIPTRDPNRTLRTVTPFLESDPVLAQMDEHLSGNFLERDHDTAARSRPGLQHGRSRQDRTDPDVRSHQRRTRADHRRRRPDRPQRRRPSSAEMTARLEAAKLPPVAPPPAVEPTLQTHTANTVQQDYFTAVTTRAILPLFKERNAPFVLVFWSRDPDGTQHFQADSLQSLVPGINGPTTLAAIRNADDDLARIRAALAELGLLDTTDIIVVADHGFSTIAKDSRTSHTVGIRIDGTLEGQLPSGFLALDLAFALHLPLHDPDAGNIIVADGGKPARGNGLIGEDVNRPDVVVAANGGSDLIYLRDGDRDMAKRVIDALMDQDYVSGIFVDSGFGKFPGTLSLRDIGLEDQAATRQPSIVVGFRSFDTVCGEPVRCAVEIADTPLQMGQGMHGSFSRADTWNFQAMQGPDFRSHFVDPAPSSNADIGRTIAHLLGAEVSHSDKLVGRVLSEALPDGVVPPVTGCTVMSDPAPNGLVTVLDMQMAGTTRYFDAGGFLGRAVGLSTAPLPCGAR